MLKRGNQSGNSDVGAPAGPQPEPSLAAADEAVDDATEPVAPPPALSIVPADAEEPAPADSHDDDLLNVFATTGIEVEDRSVLVAMAGDVDIDDVVAELQLVAAALNLTRPALPNAA